MSRPICKWNQESIEDVLIEHRFESIKAWRIDHWSSHLAAQRLRIVPLLASKYKMDYNPRMGRHNKGNG